MNKNWIEKNILTKNELLLYGTLAENYTEIQAEEFFGNLKEEIVKYQQIPSNRAAYYHEHIDNLLKDLIKRDKRYGYPEPFCHKGCSNCCHEVVYCTDEEAQLISQYSATNSITIDNEKIKKQLNVLDFDNMRNHIGSSNWDQLSFEEKACIFLDKKNKSCKIWPVRPLVCRVHLAEGTDKYCHPINGEINPNAIGIMYPEWSYILSAVFTMHSSSIKKTMIAQLRS